MYRLRYDRNIRINVGDYESISPSVGMDMEFPDDKDKRTAFQELKTQVDSLFCEEVIRQLSDIIAIRSTNPGNSGAVDKLGATSKWAIDRLQHLAKQ